jgi:tetratricopeptide (TPR) repeat protein
VDVDRPEGRDIVEMAVRGSVRPTGTSCCPSTSSALAVETRPVSGPSFAGNDAYLLMMKASTPCSGEERRRVSDRPTPGVRWRIMNEMPERSSSRGPSPVGDGRRRVDGEFGPVTRTVMWCGTFLRFGLLSAAVALSATTASALDPNARVADDEPLIPTVQALAPLPATVAPVLSQLPPGISPKLVGPTVAGNAISASEAFRAGTRLYYEGDRKAAIEQLKRAAESGHPIAQWKLGRIYQTGDGVPANDAKAFEFYNQVANNHADDSPNSPQSAFVASSFVALGGYYLKGVENTAIRPNVQKAREIYTYAASYFGDADAQYSLGRLYLDAASKERDPKQAARWLKVAAKKGHVGAQALLGQLLFTGDDDMPRRPAQGLMWLTVARANAHAVSEDWVRDAQEQAFSVASEQERRLGVAQAQDWIAKAGNQ